MIFKNYLTRRRKVKNFKKHSTDWQLPSEIYELAGEKNVNFLEEVLKHPLNLKQERPKAAYLIDGGFVFLKSTIKETIN